MKTSPAPTRSHTETALWTGYTVFLLIIVPMLPLGKYGGGILMLAGALLGLAAYLFRHGAPLRKAGRLGSFFLVLAVSAVSGAVLAAVLHLLLTR